jgi:hypothetical protein
VGVGEQVQEHPCRVPYFEAIQFLLDSDFLIVPGSDDPQYTASKIFPYILARKPLLAVFHERSSVVEIVRKTQAGVVLSFAAGQSVEIDADRFVKQWVEVLAALPFSPEVNWAAFTPYTASEMTRQQCELFDKVTALTC